ncbi:MAG: (2Fe-2S)-binding protein [Ilumatobacteraceae bacterium]
MVVCSCRAVTDRTVHAAIRAGAYTVDQVASLCTAGSRCGGCWPELQRLLAEYDDVGKTASEHAA